MFAFTQMVSNITQQFFFCFFFCSQFQEFQVFPINTNNSYQHHSFVNKQLNCCKYCHVLLTIQINITHLFSTQLNGQTVLFQIIRFNVSHSFKCQTLLFNPLIGPYHVLPIRARVDGGAVTKKENSIFPKVPRLEPHHQIVLSHIEDTR